MPTLIRSEKEHSTPRPASKDASFAALPVELFELIAEAADPTDLFAIRLVNKLASAKVLRTHARRNFATLKLMLQLESSLYKALEIAKHPIFGKAIETVTFIVDELEPRRALKIRGPAFYERTRRGLTDLFIALGDRTKRLNLTHSTKNRLINTEDFRSALRDVLDIHNRQPFLLTLLHAARQAGAQIAELSTRGYPLDISAIQKDFRERHHEMEQLTSILQNIEKFDLDIILDNKKDKRNDAFFDWLAAAPRLKHLVISTGTGDAHPWGKSTLALGYWHCQHFWLLMQSLERKFPCLEKFELRYATGVDYSDLMAFLARNMTVEEVRFEGTEIRISTTDMSSYGQAEDKHPCELLQERTSMKKFASDGAFRYANGSQHWVKEWTFETGLDS